MVNGAALCNVGAGVQLETFETNLHHVFDDHLFQTPLIFLETIKTLEKSHYHRICVVVEIFDFGIQRRAVIFELPELKAVLCYHQHHTDALKPADRSKCASVADNRCSLTIRLDYFYVNQ